MSGSGNSALDAYLLSLGINPNGGKTAATIQAVQQAQAHYTSIYGKYNSGGGGSGANSISGVSEIAGANDWVNVSQNSSLVATNIDGSDQKQAGSSGSDTSGGSGSPASTSSTQTQSTGVSGSTISGVQNELPDSTIGAGVAGLNEQAYGYMDPIDNFIEGLTVTGDALSAAGEDTLLGTAGELMSSEAGFAGAIIVGGQVISGAISPGEGLLKVGVPILISLTPPGANAVLGMNYIVSQVAWSAYKSRE